MRSDFRLTKKQRSEAEELSVGMAVYAWGILTQNPKPKVKRHFEAEIIRLGELMRKVHPKLLPPQAHNLTKL